MHGDFHVSMVLPWCFLGTFLGLPWDFHRGTQCFHGITMELPWDCHGCSLAHHFIFAETDGSFVRSGFCFHESNSYFFHVSRWKLPRTIHGSVYYFSGSCLFLGSSRGFDGCLRASPNYIYIYIDIHIYFHGDACYGGDTPIPSEGLDVRSSIPHPGFVLRNTHA